MKRSFRESTVGTEMKDRIADLESRARVAKQISTAVELDSVNAFFPIEMAPLTKAVGPYGVRYDLTGDEGKEAVGNNLYVVARGVEPGIRELSVELAAYAGAVMQEKRLNALVFDVPSGMLDNPDSLLNRQAFPDTDYVHPSIAYDATGVAGYKYWMVASILPAYGTTATWEDEDVFVSNDAVTWLRIQSLYESGKTYTAPTFRLPPHDFATDARRHGLLPVPGAGEVIEISSPAHNGNPEVDRQTVTLTGLPFKHDPAILIDGGYVYFYLSYHVPYGGSGNGTHRFLVCVRTSDGINWEAVRSDGSTLSLSTASVARQLFTKDGSGRYNYLNYAHATGNSNPEVIKYGPGDYELVYGANFSRRHAGTTPYNFNFGASLPFQEVGSGNHPGLLLSGGTLYLINNSGFYSSTNRGETLTLLPAYPNWMGGVTNLAYKKALCIGEGGKVILTQVKRQSNAAFLPQNEGQFGQTARSHAMFIIEYPSVASLVEMATGGLVDGYADIQVDQVNQTSSRKVSRFFPYVGITSVSSGVNSPMQRVKVCDLVVEDGDIIHIYISLTARRQARLRFNGLEIAP